LKYINTKTCFTNPDIYQALFYSISIAYAKIVGLKILLELTTEMGLQ